MAISRRAIREAAYEANRLAATTLPRDVRDAFRRVSAAETHHLAKFVMEKIVENFEVAEADQRPLCADVGVPRFYVKIGNEASVDGGFVALERSLREATAQVTRDLALRSNRTHPITWRNPGTNVGIMSPNVVYRFEPGSDAVELTAVHKGGAFGSDFRMLLEGEGVDGIKRFFLDAVSEFGKHGLTCPPVIIGVGLGGTKDQAFSLGKEAATLRLIGERHPDPAVARLEAELLELANSLGIGPMGYPGQVYALGVHVEIAHTHSALLPAGVHQLCQAARRATTRVNGDGTIEALDDPRWFTPYSRRDGIE